MKKLIINYVLQILLLVSVTVVDSYRMLFLSPIAAKSHKNFYNGIIEALAEKEHQVTVVSPFKAPRPNPYIKDIIIENNNLEALMPNVFQGHPLAPLISLFHIGPDLCAQSLQQENVQNLKKEKFDLILISGFVSDCYFSLVHELQIPFVHIFPASLVSPIAKMIGNPIFPSFAPDSLLAEVHPMTFSQRIKSVLIATLFPFAMPLIEYVGFQKCVEKGLCSKDLPSFGEIKRNGSAVIINSIRTMERPARPYNLNVIHAGGIHCQEAKPLSKDLEDWINNSGDSGFIFFSLGSAVRSSDMPEKYKNTLIKVFGSLKQSVLWKWNEDEIENLPSNVKIGKWFPQQDLLAHQKLRVFITHGGLHSIHESIFHKAKIIGMPLFGDQQKNMYQVQDEGWGKVLEWSDLTFDSLKNLIDEVIADENMKTICKEKSEVMKDQIRNPKSEIAYWMEYIVRHKGAKHLRSPVLDLTWYEIYNIDVWILLITVASVILIVQLTILKCCIKNCMKKIEGLIEGRKKKKE